MSFIAQSGITILALTWVSQVVVYRVYKTRPEGLVSFRRRIGALIRWVFWISIVFVLVSAFYAVVEQYRAWSADSLAVYYLPPYQELSYFISYSTDRYVVGPLIAIAAAFLLLFFSKYYNAKFESRFLEEEESSIFALGILLSGYPGLFFYLVSMFAAGFLLTAWYAIHKKGRAPFYFLWLPVAIFAILIVGLVIPPNVLALFHF